MKDIFNSLILMGKGMLAIFVVIIVIYLVILLLLRFNKVKSES